MRLINKNEIKKYLINIYIEASNFEIRSYKCLLNL